MDGKLKKISYAYSDYDGYTCKISKNGVDIHLTKFVKKCNDYYAMISLIDTDSDFTDELNMFYNP